MSDLSSSQTEKNLITAFAGESQARNRYTYFASAAKKEGYEQISRIFAETAEQEKEHAKRFFKFLQGGDVMVQAEFPAGVIGVTLDNLHAASAGEHYEWTEMYPGFADLAADEGFKDIAATFHAISVAERQHEKRYNDLAANLAAGRVFKREQPVVWRCLNCGYLHQGTEAPDSCPACLHPRSYYELLGENW